MNSDRTRIVHAVYISDTPDGNLDFPTSALAKEFRTELAAACWPYDVGDDPSFFSSSKISGPVTWGVCRQDVRNQLQVGDGVMFFALHYDRERGIANYYFVAVFRVVALLSMNDVFADARFPKYLNLLVRPKHPGWEHFEPALPRRHWHDDWMWRVCDHTKLRKQSFLHACSNHQPGNPLLVRGQVVPFAPNYVVFSQEASSSLILERPEYVATWHRPDEFEIWRTTQRAELIRSLAFRGSTRRHLRTRNRYQPHRHFWAQLDIGIEPLVLEIGKHFQPSELHERPET